MTNNELNYKKFYELERQEKVFSLFEITYVENESGDWCGIYVGNKLQVEGHSIPYFTWVNLINEFKSFSRAMSYEICDSYLEEIGGLPDDFSSIPEAELIE